MRGTMLQLVRFRDEQVEFGWFAASDERSHACSRADETRRPGLARKFHACNLLLLGSEGALTTLPHARALLDLRTAP